MLMWNNIMDYNSIQFNSIQSSSSANLSPAVFSTYMYSYSIKSSILSVISYFLMLSLIFRGYNPNWNKSLNLVISILEGNSSFRKWRIYSKFISRSYYMLISRTHNPICIHHFHPYTKNPSHNIHTISPCIYPQRVMIQATKCLDFLVLKMME